MLSFDDTERIVDLADEYGLPIDGDNASDVWDRCCASRGESEMPLPFNTEELLKMLRGACACDA